MTQRSPDIRVCPKVNAATLVDNASNPVAPRFQALGDDARSFTDVHPGYAGAIKPDVEHSW